jgi:glycosyltransferase involved in cell wall biosynthesis
VTGTDAVRVVVAVLTYRRPRDLAEALPALVRQATTVDPAAEVLVVDNDPDAGARQVVADLGSPLVRYVHEPTPGIAAARNRALAESDHDVLVFIDDDERPSPAWLASLLEVYRRDRPAGVAGRVVSELTVEPDPWIAAGRFFERLRHPTGAPVPAAATNNLLLDLAQVRSLGLDFDERLGLSGGSDNLFTRQLVRRGGRLVWCDEAYVVDVVPPSRVTRSWVLRRAYRTGNTEARVSVDLAGGGVERGAARLRETGRGVVRIAGGSGRWAVGVLRRSLGDRARGRRTIARGSGMIAGAWGMIYSEYARSGA